MLGNISWLSHKARFYYTGGKINTAKVISQGLMNGIWANDFGVHSSK
jgi:hypothetical protein